MPESMKMPGTGPVITMRLGKRERNRASTVGLVRGAARLLPPNGTLFLYGPYFRDGVETAPSNLAFDRELRDRNQAWGIRALEEVAALARAHGFADPLVTAMPANNLSLVLRRR